VVTFGGATTVGGGSIRQLRRRRCWRKGLRRKGEAQELDCSGRREPPEPKKDGGVRARRRAVELDGGGRWEPPELKEEGGTGARKKAIVNRPFGWWAGGDFLQTMTLILSPSAISNRARPSLHACGS
jgi:hypothetical protein